MMFPFPPTPQQEFFLPLTVYIAAEIADSPTKTTQNEIISPGLTRV